MFHEYLLGYSRNPPYSTYSIIASLLIENCIPLGKRKLDEMFERCQYDNAGKPSLFQSLFIKVYPSISFTYEISFSVFLLLYLLKKTQYLTPFLCIQSKTLLQQLKINEGIEIVDKMFNLCKVLVPVSLLVMYNAESLSEKISNILFKSSSSAVAPKVFTSEKGAIQLPCDINCCPLCKKVIVNEYFLKTGYRFCYSCIAKYLDEHSQCPISLKPCNRSHLIKIYRD